MHLFVCILFNVLFARYTIGVNPKVSFPKGSLEGKFFSTRGGRQIEAFYGIPYAKPPVGDLRFEPPQPEDLILGDMIAQTMPHPCTQPEYLLADSEDCLYINVFTPNASAVQPLPVYAFIFGGEYFKGFVTNLTPDYLLDEDILLVAIQFRVGLFGFLSTGDEVMPGNMALKDIRCALRWIRDNIWRFGGDPDKVTLGGGSSGASTTNMLLTFMADEGLFRAGIAESGSEAATYTYIPPVGIKWIADVIANVSDCPRNSIDFKNCLKAKPAKDLVDILYPFILYLMDSENNAMRAVPFFKTHPIIGPVLEPACVEDRIVTGNPWHYNTTLPFLIGVNGMEFLPAFFCSSNGVTTYYSLLDDSFDEGFPKCVKYQYSSANGSMVPLAFRDFYLDNKPFNRSNLANGAYGISDAFIIYPSFEAAMRSKSPNTYFYLFDYIGNNSMYNIPEEDRLGAVHVDEVYYLFPVTYGSHNKPSDSDIQLSHDMVKMWTNFIKYLDPTPNSTQGLEWLPFHPNQSYLHFKQDGKEMGQNFLRERMDFWRSQPFPFRDDPDSELLCVAEP